MINNNYTNSLLKESLKRLDDVKVTMISITNIIFKRLYYYKIKYVIK